MNHELHPSSFTWLPHPSSFTLHPTMNQCPIHYATMQESPTYHRSAIDPATTAIAEVHLTRKPFQLHNSASFVKATMVATAGGLAADRSIASFVRTNACKSPCEESKERRATAKEYGKPSLQWMAEHHL